MIFKLLYIIKCVNIKKKNKKKNKKNKVVDQSIDKDRDRYVCVNAYVSKEQRNTRIIKQFKGIDKRAKEKT